MQNNEIMNEWINWIEEAINKKHIKYYEYENFKNIQEIGSGTFGKIFRANWKCFDHYLALELQRHIDFHNNIIRFYGITKHESCTENIFNPTKNYLLVMEYASSGTLGDYLKNNFHGLTWNNKYNLAYLLACSVLCLHEEGIIHWDLPVTCLFIKIPLIFILNGKKLDEKSDIYSIGVLLLEISSGKPPFHEEKYDFSLMYKISQGRRETTVPNTPNDYSNLYTGKCKCIVSLFIPTF
ncbi:unnamed protein product [Rhizophagus irregularis]|nr:unnamed protein product [Rhizophagus irregularis]